MNLTSSTRSSPCQRQRQDSAPGGREHHRLLRPLARPPAGPEPLPPASPRHPCLTERSAGCSMREQTNPIVPIRNQGFVQPTAARQISFEDSLVFERLHEQTYRDPRVPAGRGARSWPLADRVGLIRQTASQRRQAEPSRRPTTQRTAKYKSNKISGQLKFTGAKYGSQSQPIWPIGHRVARSMRNWPSEMRTYNTTGRYKKM